MKIIWKLIKGSPHPYRIRSGSAKLYGLIIIIIIILSALALMCGWTHTYYCHFACMAYVVHYHVHQIENRKQKSKNHRLASDFLAKE